MQGRISAYRLSTFEDAIIFVFDVERCLGELDDLEYAVIARAPCIAPRVRSFAYCLTRSTIYPKSSCGGASCAVPRSSRNPVKRLKTVFLI
jgi:hypothetical protein